MALVAESNEVSLATLQELFVALRTDLDDLEEMVAHPRGAVLDPASLRTASELLQSARALLRGTVPSDRGELARRSNLAYAVLRAVIDLVKSHTDVPRVPRASKTPTEG